MTTDSTLAVKPVVDYEPPPRRVQQCLPPEPVVSRRARRHTPHRNPDRQPTAPMSAPMRQAAAFADAALRRVLEVVDRRRPAAQLRHLLTADLVDSLPAARRAAPSADGAAMLRRVRLQAVGREDPSTPLTAAEVFGTYRRGRRIHALACRIEQVQTTGDTRWRVVALHIG